MPWGQRRLRFLIIPALATAAVALAACTSDSPDGDRGAPPPLVASGGTSAAAPLTASAPRDGREAASFAVLGGATSVTVRSADIDDDLFRVSVPDGAPIRPAAVVTGNDVQLQVVATAGGGASALDIQLSDDVVWDVRLSGGASDTVVDLAGGRLSGLAFTAGSSRIEATLPAPSGEVVVRMSGGASEFIVHRPAGAPVLARLAGGAGSVSIDGVASSGIAGGEQQSTPDYGAAPDRYLVDCTAGLSALIIDTY